MTNPKFERFHDRLLNLLNEFDYCLTDGHAAIIVLDGRPGEPRIYCDFADQTEPSAAPTRQPINLSGSVLDILRLFEKHDPGEQRTERLKDILYKMLEQWESRPCPRKPAV